MSTCGGTEVDADTVVIEEEEKAIPVGRISSSYISLATYIHVHIWHCSQLCVAIALLY